MASHDSEQPYRRVGCGICDFAILRIRGFAVLRFCGFAVLGRNRPGFCLEANFALVRATLLSIARFLLATLCFLFGILASFGQFSVFWFDHPVVCFGLVEGVYKIVAVITLLKLTSLKFNYTALH